MKLIIAIALLLFSSTAILAQLPPSKIYESSFAQAPKVIINAADSSDKNFVDKLTYPLLFYSPGESADTLYAWAVLWDNDANASKSITKRTLDASTLKTKGDDITLDIQIKTKEVVPLTVEAGVGCVGIPSLRDDGADTPDQLYFYVLLSNATSDTKPIEIKLSNNTNPNITFLVHHILFQGSYFYIAFIEFDKTTELEKSFQLQGIKGDGSLLFPSTIEIASFSPGNPHDMTMPVTVPDNATNPTFIYCVYKVNDSVIMQTKAMVADSKVEEPVTLQADTDMVKYYPENSISASSVLGIILSRIAFKDEKKVDFDRSYRVFFNGATSDPQPLNLTAPEGYAFPVLHMFDYPDGFAITSQYFGKDTSAYTVKIFNTDGTEKVPQKNLARLHLSQGNMRFIQDVAGAVWAGFSDFNLRHRKFEKAYLGKVIA